MKTIKIIDALYLDEEGVKAKSKNGRLQTVHLQQGDLDGACAVYSSMMILILIGSVNYNDIRLFGNSFDKRSRIERLKKELLEIRGMHREGTHFFHKHYDNIKNMLEHSYGKLISVDHIDYTDKDIVESIKKVINSNQPVIISIAFKGGSAHALVAIGMEYDENKNPTKILCLDPGYPTPKFTYWNSVIELNSKTGKFSHLNITETGKSQFVQLQDILVIKKK